MPNMKWTKGEETFTFSCALAYPVDNPAAVNVVTDYSEGGQMYAYNKGISEKFFNVTIDDGNQTDYDNVENWLLSVAVGPKNSFTCTDENEVEHTVRMLDTKNPLQGDSHDRYSGTIHLREEL